MRRDEINGSVPGAFFFLLAITILLILYPDVVVMSSLCHLCFGDAVAAVVGQAIPSARISKWTGSKSMAGSFSLMLICTLSTGFVYLSTPYISWKGDEPDIWILGIISLVSGVAAMVGELLSTPLGIDDNLTLPLLSAICTFYTAHALGLRVNVDRAWFHHNFAKPCGEEFTDVIQSFFINESDHSLANPCFEPIFKLATTEDY